MRSFLRSIELATRYYVTVLLALMFSGVMVWLMMRIVGLNVSLPAVELGLGLLIACLVVNRGKTEPQAQQVVPVTPVRPRRRMTPEDLVILEVMLKRGQISPEQFNAAVQEALPPVPPALPANDGRRGRR